MANSQVSGGGAILASKENEITVGTTAPTSPTRGWIWVDTSDVTAPLINVVKSWDGSAWTAIAILPTLVDAVGDLLVGSAVDSVERLAKGTDNQILRSLASEPNDLGWYTPVDSVTPAALTVGGAGTAGTSLIFARRDHVHGVTGNSLNGSGTSTSASITLASIPGYAAGKVVRIHFSLLNSTVSLPTLRFNGLSTTIYTAKNDPDGVFTLTGGLSGIPLGNTTNSRYNLDMTFQEVPSAPYIMGTVMEWNGSPSQIYQAGGWASLGLTVTTIDISWSGSISYSWRAECY